MYIILFNVVYYIIKIFYVLFLNLIFLGINWWLIPLYMEYFFIIYNIVMFMFICIFHEIYLSIIIFICSMCWIVYNLSYNLKKKYNFISNYPLIPYLRPKYKNFEKNFYWLRENYYIPYVFMDYSYKIQYIGILLFIIYILLLFLIYTNILMHVVKQYNTINITVFIILILVSYFVLIYSYLNIINKKYTIVFKKFKFFKLITLNSVFFLNILCMLVIFIDVNIIQNIIYTYGLNIVSWDLYVYLEEFWNILNNIKLKNFEIIPKINIFVENILKIISFLRPKKTVLKSRDYYPIYYDNIVEKFNKIKELKVYKTEDSKLQNIFEKIFKDVNESSKMNKLNTLEYFTVMEGSLFKKYIPINKYKFYDYRINTNFRYIDIFTGKIPFISKYTDIISLKNIKKFHTLKLKNARSSAYNKSKFVQRKKKRMWKYFYKTKISKKKPKFWIKLWRKLFRIWNIKMFKKKIKIKRKKDINLSKKTNLELNIHNLNTYNYGYIQKVCYRLDSILELERQNKYWFRKMDLYYDLLNFRRMYLAKKVYRLRTKELKIICHTVAYKKYQLKPWLNPWSTKKYSWNRFFKEYIKNKKLEFWIKNNFMYEVKLYKHIKNWKYFIKWNNKTNNFWNIIKYLENKFNFLNYKKEKLLKIIYKKVRKNIQYEKLKTMKINKHNKLCLWKYIEIRNRGRNIKKKINFIHMHKYAKQDLFPVNPNWFYKYTLSQEENIKKYNKTLIYTQLIRLRNLVGNLSHYLKYERNHMYVENIKYVYDWNYLNIINYIDYVRKGGLKNKRYINYINNIKSSVLYNNKLYRSSWKGLIKPKKKDKNEKRKYIGLTKKWKKKLVEKF